LSPSGRFGSITREVLKSFFRLNKSKKMQQHVALASKVKIKQEKAFSEVYKGVNCDYPQKQSLECKLHSILKHTGNT
jgi:hypothetical protein